MAELFEILGVVFGTLALLCLSIYIGLAVRGHSELLYSTAHTLDLPWHQSAFLLFAAGGFLVCMYQGAEFMLSWTDVWSSVDEYGEYQRLSSYLAGLFAMVGGLTFGEFIDGATHDKCHLRQTDLRDRELERMLDSLSYGRAKEVRALAAEYETKAAELSGTIPYSSAKFQWSPDNRKATVYRKLAHLAREYEVRLTTNGADQRLEDYMRRVDEDRKHEEENRKRAEERYRKREADAEWETEYLRKNPGARIIVRGGDESKNGSWLALRELLSPSGEVIRSSQFGLLVD